MKNLLSMTAFGRGDYVEGARSWTVEIRSVNHRYCDISVKMPRKYMVLEERIKKKIAEYYNRGRIEVLMSLSGDLSEGQTLEANLPLAREYYQCLQAIRKDLSLSESSDLALIVANRDVITAVEQEEDMEAIWSAVEKALEEALQNGMQMRRNEGESLKKDMKERLSEFSKIVAAIETSVPDLVLKKEASLKERLENLLAGVDLDPVRLAQEVAIIADKSDITEEIVRLLSHIQQFGNFLELGEPVGRRLDFLLQEFLREVNTMASKIADPVVTHQTVTLKNEVEKIREQVQNLE